MEASMVEKELTAQHIGIAETFIRLYVFLTQYIDSCEGETVRKDYPEVTPTAMSNFVCDRCGKPFQNQNDLVQHQRFESGSTVT